MDTCRFTKDDLQSMDFSAYLASSSSESDGGEGGEGGEGSEEEEEQGGTDKALKYKVRLNTLSEEQKAK